MGDWELTNQHPAWKILQEMLWEILWDRVEGKNLFKKGSDWWQFGTWHRVMGSQPISIQLGKFCRKCWGECCGKFCGECCGKCCGKCCGEIVGNLLGNSAENAAGNVV